MRPYDFAVGRCMNGVIWLNRVDEFRVVVVDVEYFHQDLSCGC